MEKTEPDSSSFVEAVRQIHRTLNRPRLAHLVGYTTTYCVALFSQLHLHEGQTSGPQDLEFLILHRRLTSLSTANQAVNGPRSIFWRPNLLSLQPAGGWGGPLDVPLRSAESNAQPMPTYDGFEVIADPDPLIPTFEVPANPEELVTLLLQHGQTVE